MVSTLGNINRYKYDNEWLLSFISKELLTDRDILKKKISYTAYIYTYACCERLYKTTQNTTISAFKHVFPQKTFCLIEDIDQTCLVWKPHFFSHGVRVLRDNI